MGSREFVKIDDGISIMGSVFEKRTGISVINQLFPLHELSWKKKHERN